MTTPPKIISVLEAKGGTVTLTQSGDILFTPDASYTGVMGFKYTVQDAQGNYTQVTSPTGQTVAMKAAVYLQTSDIPNDPLAVEQWYLADTNYYKNRSCLRTYILGCRHKRLSKQLKSDSKRPLNKQNNCGKLIKPNSSCVKYVSGPKDTGASSYELENKQQHVIYAIR